MTQDSCSPSCACTNRVRAGFRLFAITGLSYLALGSFVGCGSTNNSANSSSSSTSTILASVVTKPTTIDLYPSTESNRLYIFLTAVGQESVHLPLIFDTGSAGITLYAPKVFPPSMFTSTGTLIFPPGHSSFTYDGVTVTNQRISREYGGAGGTTENGYLAYANVTFGDSSSQLTTGTMPLFLYYSSTAANSQNPSGFSPAQGIFGVDPLADPFTATSLSPGTPACTAGARTPCYVVSVLKYLTYGNSTDAGFEVTPATLQQCSLLITGNCLPEPMLSVGIAPSSVQGFSITDLSCPPNGTELPAYYGPPRILNYPVCEKSIPNGTVTMSGPVTGRASGRFLFDSGTEAMIFFPSPGSDLPPSVPAQTTVLVGLPSGFTYEYASSASPTSSNYTLVDINVNNQQNHVGVGFFETNSFFIDYTKGSEGWK